MDTVGLATCADNLGNSPVIDLVPPRVDAKVIISTSACWTHDLSAGSMEETVEGVPTAQVVGDDRLMVDRRHMEYALRGGLDYGRDESYSIAGTHTGTHLGPWPERR